jgi:hypothetical protein
MNIKNRLKKMENQVIGNDSEFCDCEKEVKFKIITCPEDDIESPGVCEFCNKPMPEPFRCTLNISTNAQLDGEIK